MRFMKGVWWVSTGARQLKLEWAASGLAGGGGLLLSLKRWAAGRAATETIRGMSTDRHTLLQTCDTLLQPERFKDYGPNGLQVEGRQEVRRLVSGVTASVALIEAAIAVGADAILVHHGLFWRGQDGRVTGWMKQRLQRLLAHDISLLAYHLPLDAHPGWGNNAPLGRVLGFEGGAPCFGEQNLGWMAPLEGLDVPALARRVEGLFRGRHCRRGRCLQHGGDLRAAGALRARDGGRLPGCRPPCHRALRCPGAGGGGGPSAGCFASIHRH